MIKSEHQISDALTEEDDAIVHRYLGDKWLTRLKKPEIMIYGSSDYPYIYRWHLHPYENGRPNTYFHVQVQDDPDRPLHDHPWDNCSVILSGGYDEWIDNRPMGEMPQKVRRNPGDMVFRRAEQAHRLLIPNGVPYSLSLFHTGQKRRSWGFWVIQSTGPKWFPASECIVDHGDGRSMFQMPKDPNR